MNDCRTVCTRVQYFVVKHFHQKTYDGSSRDMFLVVVGLKRMHIVV